MKKRLLKLGLVGVLIALLVMAGCVVYFWWTLPNGINRASVWRIEKGMTIKQVEEALGKPPDNAISYRWHMQVYGWGYFWRGVDGTLIVDSDTAHTVLDRSFMPKEADLFVDRVLHFLKLD